MLSHLHPYKNFEIIKTIYNLLIIFEIVSNIYNLVKSFEIINNIYNPIE